MAYGAEDRRLLRRAGLFAGCAVVAVIAVFFWANRVDRNRNLARFDTAGAPPSAASESAALPRGTTGRSALPGTPGASDTIRELVAITDAPDAHALVGRRVELRTTVTDIASDIAFWVGPQEDRVLVVVGRNDRLEQRNSAGESVRRITTLHMGEPLAIIGTVQTMPPASERSQWGASQESKGENRAIYIRADTVSPR